MIRIIYYFIISFVLFAFGFYLLARYGDSRGAYAALLAGLVQGIIGMYLLRKRNKLKAHSKDEDSIV